jgi:chloramphenicol 3-O-phosphotransferase
VFILEEVRMDKGIIIILSGVSSSGKTTLARTIQNKASENYWYLSNDNFASVCPQKFIEADRPEAIKQTMILMGNTIKTFSDCGKNIVVDTLILSQDRYTMYMNLLSDYPLCMVNVSCPLDELQRREKKRGDRNIGTAESQLPDLLAQDLYNITLNTFTQTPDECVDMIFTVITDKYKRIV